MESYLLRREEAARRYGMSMRAFEEFYKRHPDFPIVRVGKKVLTNWREADKWFDGYICDNTEDYVT